MFLSPNKLALLILLVFAVWYGARWINRVSAIMAAGRAPPPQPRPQSAIEDLVMCRACGAYVAAGARHCGRPRCPQPRG